MMLEPMAAQQALRSLYDSSIGPYLTAQDSQVRAALRNRWLVLVVGLAFAGFVLWWAVSSGSQAEFLPAISFGLGVMSIGYFVITKNALSHLVRDHVMAQIAPLLCLRFESHPKDPFAERFELLGLARCSSVILTDRLSCEIGGRAVDMMTAKLTHTSKTGVGGGARTQTSVRFSGVLMRLGDPEPPSVRFRLIPPATLSPDGMLRGKTITIRNAGPGTSRTDMRALLGATPEEAPITPTGDPVFDARFELHASAPDVAAAMARLDAETRSALVEVADMFGGGPASAGFEGGGILLAFVTKQRFEIGPLKPPLAQFERVEHLAEQMGVVSKIAERLGVKG